MEGGLCVVVFAVRCYAQSGVCLISGFYSILNAILQDIDYIERIQKNIMNTQSLFLRNIRSVMTKP